MPQMSYMWPLDFPSCADIRNWIRNIEQHASDNVNKILVGNKADMDESKRVCPCSLSFSFSPYLSGCLFACVACMWMIYL